MAEWIGRTVSKVKIQKLLGRGGMAEVFSGLHTTLNRPVAVKILHGYLSDDATLMARFRSEAQAVASLRHPNIVQVLDFDVVDDRPYMILELIEGPSLADYMFALGRRGQTIDPETMARVVSAVGAALDYAHARGIVHRDVKPSNVLLRREAGRFDPTGPLPDDVQPVLTDFGVARMANATLRTASGAIVGTPAYMSPEQVSGEAVDMRSDIYSLGVMVYEMIARRLPFETESETAVSTLIKHITEPPAPLPEATPVVQAVVLRALSKDREQRYQSAGDLARDLRAALGLPTTPGDLAVSPAVSPSMSRPVTPATAAPAVHTLPASTKPRCALFSLAAIVILLVIGIAGALLGGDLLSDEAGTTPANGAGGMATSEEVFGVLSFGSEAAENDHITLDVALLTRPPDDAQYEVWLVGGETRRSLGILEVDANGSGTLDFRAEEGENLLADFGRFEITLEPSPDTNPLPTGDVVFSGAVPAGSLTHIRHLLVGFSRTPEQIGLVTGLVRDAELILSTAQALEDAQRQEDLVEIKRQAEGLVNLIEGDGGDNFGDINGDGEITNPGDGFGLLPSARSTGYIQSAIEHARYAAGSSDATVHIIQGAQALETSAQNLGEWAAQLRDLGLEIATVEDAGALEESVLHIIQLADRFSDGQDVNNDGTIEPIRGEGGTDLVLLQARQMADMFVLPGPNRIPEPAETNPAPNIVPEGES